MQMRSMVIAVTIGCATVFGGHAHGQDFLSLGQELSRQCARGILAGVVHVRVRGAVAYERARGYAGAPT